MKRQKIRKGKPLIGITCEVVKCKSSFTQFELVCDYRYIRAILRSGGIPILMPINPMKRDLAQLIDEVHGIIIIGGDDINPRFYGEKVHCKTKPNYCGRVYYELDLIRLAKKRKLPILGICYGMQLLNVAFGGTLHQDIPSQVKGAMNHRSKGNPIHHVTAEKGSLCHRIFGKRKFQVHSSHHQAVKVPGKSLRITAFSEDGIPEALEIKPNVLGVQWHPERSPKDSVQAKLFRYFIRLAKNQMSF